MLFLPLGREAGFSLLTIAGTMVLFLSAGKGYVALQVHQKYALRIAQRSVRGKAGFPALLSRSFCADFLFAPVCLTTVLLQSLQCLAVVIHFTQSLYGLSLSRLRQTIAFCFLSILQLLET